MELALFIIAIILLAETIFSKILEKFSSSIPIFGVIKSFFDRHKIATVALSIGLLLTSFILGEWDKKKVEIRDLEQKNKILRLETESKDIIIRAQRLEILSKNLELKAEKSERTLKEYKQKLNDSNTIIKNISITYSVGFEASDVIFSDSVILGPSVIYAQLGLNVMLKSTGITYRFIPLGLNKFIVELNASLADGDFPIGNNVDMFKSYKQLNIFIPFLRNGNRYDSFMVNNYSIMLQINGIRVSPIVSFEKMNYPIGSGPYPTTEGKIFGTISHKFSKNLYEDLQLNRYLRTY